MLGAKIVTVGYHRLASLGKAEHVAGLFPPKVGISTKTDRVALHPPELPTRDL